MAQPELFQRRREIIPSENSFFGGQNDLRPNPGCLFLAELHLVLKFRGGCEPRAENIREHTSAKANHDNQHDRKTTIHSFPLSFAACFDWLCLAMKRTKCIS